MESSRLIFLIHWRISRTSCNGARHVDVGIVRVLCKADTRTGRHCKGLVREISGRENKEGTKRLGEILDRDASLTSGKGERERREAGWKHLRLSCSSERFSNAIRGFLGQS